MPLVGELRGAASQPMHRPFLYPVQHSGCIAERPTTVVQMKSPHHGPSNAAALVGSNVEP